MNKPTLNLAAISLALVALAAALPANAAPAAAASASSATSAAKPAKKTTKAAKAKPAEDKVVDEPEPEIGGSTTTEYACELGNKITIYQNDNDKDNIALRWKKRLHRLSRIETTTGAQRFENKNYGLIWIGIPSKGMLLDSKQNRQLANECRTEEQIKAGS